MFEEPILVGEIKKILIVDGRGRPDENIARGTGGGPKFEVTPLDASKWLLKQQLYKHA